MYPFGYANVPLGVYAPKVGNLCSKFMSLVLEGNPSHWKKQYEYSGPALARAGHNAKSRRVTPLSSGCMTSLFSVNFLNESRNVYNGDPSREWKCQVMSVKPN